MAKLSPLSDDERAELVAYLDGELPKPAAQIMEAKLNTDPRMRAEVETLRRTWELLDFLPKPKPTPEFASRTLDRVSTIRLTPSPLQSRHRWRPWALRTGWAAAVLLAVLIGYGGGLQFSHRAYPPNEGEQAEVKSQLVKDFH